MTADGTPSPVSPTAVQLSALRFIAGYAEVHGGLMPRLNDVAAGLGGASRSTAKRIVDRLIERGLVVRRAHSERGLALCVVPAVPRGPDGVARYFVSADRLNGLRPKCLGHDGLIHNGETGQDHV